jgi:hypothetical protein
MEEPQIKLELEGEHTINIHCITGTDEPPRHTRAVKRLPQQ